MENPAATAGFYFFKAYFAQITLTLCFGTKIAITIKKKAWVILLLHLWGFYWV